MIFNEIRTMRGPNMWTTKYNNIIAIKFNPKAIPETKVTVQNKILEYFRIQYQFETCHDNFELCIFKYLLQLSARLQEVCLYHDLIYPTPDVLYGVIEYHIEEAGQKSLELADKIITSILNNEQIMSLNDGISEVRTIKQKKSLGPTTSLICDAARRRNIPIDVGPAGYIFLGYGKNQKRINAAMSQYTSCIGVNISCNKESTKKFLESAYLPVPSGKLIENENDLMETVEQLGYPLVTKPFNGNQGRNVTCDITNFENLLTGFRYANKLSKSVIVEKEIRGQDYRLLVIGNKFTAASLRLPASIIGDGFSSITDLVEQENRNPKRGEGHENILTKIELDAATELCLQKQGFSMSCIPAAGQHVFLKGTANLSTGGTAEDVTDLVHPYNKKLAEKAAQIIGLDICGIDLISPDITKPLAENGGAIIEVNAAPGLRMHKFPSKGIEREVGNPIVDLMFKKEDKGRIPIVAITGTNGKTTTTRLMAHVASFAGNVVGFTSTDGIYIDGEKIQTGDCSGPQSTRTILQDPTVDFAVLECARGGIIRSGLAFDECDIAIVTNVAADHLGLKDVYTVEDLAFVKIVVPASVKKDGWAILNAGNSYSYGMKEKLKCNVALFCSDETNDQLQNHLSKGGLAVYTDSQQDIYVATGASKIFIFNAAEAPITKNGKAGFMVDNLLPVVLAAYLSGMDPDQISQALKSFADSSTYTPGRINDFQINGVNVILDYAHNPHGLKALAAYLKNIPGRKLGIITGTGDRREQDIIEFGRIAADMYDDIIIRFDRDLRGRTEEEIIELLSKGIHQINPSQKFQIIADTQSAIHYAVSNAEKGSYVVICADDATYTLGLTRKVEALFQNSN